MYSLTERPRLLSQMIGQKIIIDEMKNRSIDMNFPEVMMFLGKSGSGKTTLAFIIASLLNCEHPIKNSEGYYDPCGECASCKSIKKEVFNRDTLYYDCSRLEKKDVLDIREKVFTSPLSGDRNKIIILNEAQELSKAGKGTTYDLLEMIDNVKNVHFILCTMNPEKFDEAVLSRGVPYKFKGVSEQDISEYLFSIVKKEDPNGTIYPDEFFQLEDGRPGGLFCIADAARGSIRESLRFFERCKYGKLFHPDDIERELDILSKDHLVDLLRKLLNKDKEAILKIKNIDDVESFYYSSLSMLRNSYVSKIAPSKKDKSYMQEFAVHDNLRTLVDVYKNFSSFKMNNFVIDLCEYMDDKSQEVVKKEDKPLKNNRVPI